MHHWKTTLLLAALQGAMGAAQAVTLTFDDLPTPPPLDTLGGLYFANADSPRYGGVLWDNGLSIGGDQFRVQTSPSPGPLFGIPHSGRRFLTNQGNGASNDSMTLSTPLVLTGAWFGQNEYYGFGGGADSVTVRALNGSTVLASVTLALPETHPGQPEPLSFMDTSVFTTLTGITGYLIDRHELGTQAGNWVGDDFSFSSPVPEPGPSLWLLGLAAVGLAARRARAT